MCRFEFPDNLERELSQLVANGEGLQERISVNKMKITPKMLFRGLALLLILVAILIWLAFDVFHIFNIANVVSGNPN
jgi:hypothetical protein